MLTKDKIVFAISMELYEEAVAGTVEDAVGAILAQRQSGKQIATESTKARRKDMLVSAEDPATCHDLKACDDPGKGGDG